MKNIITVLDTNHASQGAIDLSCYFARLTGSRLTGVFPDYPIDILPVYSRFVDDTAPPLVLSKQKAQSIENAISHFRRVCIQQEVNCSIHRDNEDSGGDLVIETLFADVLIVDESVSFSEEDDKIPSKFITRLLANARCPVIIAAASFDVVEEIIFAYDGTYASLFAIKQFTYLFPELTDRKIVIVEVTDREVMDEPNRLAAWLGDYYSEIAYETLQGDAAVRLLEIAMSKQKTLLVIGAFGRSALSTFFKSSAADKIIKFASNPVFIAHH